MNPHFSVISDVILHNISTFGKSWKAKRFLHGCPIWNDPWFVLVHSQHRLLPWFFSYIYVRPLRSHLRFACQERQCPYFQTSKLRKIHEYNTQVWTLCVYLFDSFCICKIHSKLEGNVFYASNIPWQCWAWSLVVFSLTAESTVQPESFCCIVFVFLFWSHWRP